MANKITTNLQEWLKTLPCEHCPARFQCSLYCGNTNGDCFKAFVDWAIREEDIEHYEDDAKNGKM